jgi:hypothetical protein
MMNKTQMMKMKKIKMDLKLTQIKIIKIILKH